MDTNNQEFTEGPVLSSDPESTEETDEMPVPRKRKKKKKGWIIVLVVLILAAGASGSYYFMQRQMRVTICARVQMPSGSKVTALVPLVTPALTAHSTAVS